MKKLLLLVGLCGLPVLTASAQTTSRWDFAGVFPDTTGIRGAARTMQLKSMSSNHGLAVDGEGKIWLLPNTAANGDSVFVPALGVKRIANAIYVYNANGTPASFSPLLFATFPDGSRDTLGGYTVSTRNPTTGAITNTWDTKSGRGLAVDGNGDVIATMFNNVYRLNHRTGAGMNKALGTLVAATAANGLSGPGVSADGKVFISGVFPGDPVALLNSNLTFKENVQTNDVGFQRSMLSSRSGDTLYVPYYDKKYVLRYIKPSEFDGFSAPDTLFRGYASESIAMQPGTGYVWLSAGSPNDKNTVDNINDNTWYAFNPRTLSATATPVPLDSVKWSFVGTQGRPRAMAFARDGQTVYLGQFSNIGEPISVHRYRRTVVNASGDSRWVPVDLTLGNVSPNPVSGNGRIQFSLHTSTNVSVKVYDLLGRAVMTLVDGARAQGANDVRFDASSLTTGMYLVRMEADGYVLSQRMTVVR